MTFLLPLKLFDRNWDHDLPYYYEQVLDKKECNDICTWKDVEYCLNLPNFFDIDVVSKHEIQKINPQKHPRSWAAHRCLSFGDSCNLLVLHRATAFPVSILVISFVIISLTQKDVLINQWHYLLTITFLIISQIFLGVLSIQLGMSEPLLVIGHQLVACLLVAVLAALNFNFFSSKSL